MSNNFGEALQCEAVVVDGETPVRAVLLDAWLNIAKWRVVTEILIRAAAPMDQSSSIPQFLVDDSEGTASNVDDYSDTDEERANYWGLAGLVEIIGPLLLLLGDKGDDWQKRATKK